VGTEIGSPVKLRQSKKNIADCNVSVCEDVSGPKKKKLRDEMGFIETCI